MQAAVPSVTVDQVPSGAFLLDVREPDEWVVGHAPGACHLPMSQVPARMAEVPRDGDVLVVCRSGIRSAQVVGFLLANGWDNVINLDGGMRAWVAAGHPLVGENGIPPEVI
jgi:rhodanese-related sulfurtransferase